MKKIYLSYGHQGKGTGAKKYVDEGTANIATGYACKDYLKNYNLEVIGDTLTSDVNEEVRIANKNNVDLAISFHENAGGGDGFEALVYDSNSKNAIRLASLMEQSAKSLGQNSRGIKYRKDLWFLKSTKMQAVIIETAFVDNINDKTAIDTPQEQQAFGHAYAKAILKYFGLADNGYQNKKKNNTTVTSAKKSLEAMAKEIWRGTFGNGWLKRSIALKKLGYTTAEITEIRKIVNKGK